MKRRVLKILSVVSMALCLVWIGAWIYSLADRRLPRLAMAYAGQKSLFQVHCADHALHLVLVVGRYPHDAGFRFERVNRNDRYHDGARFAALGFVVAYLGSTFYGGDYITSPFFALVLPYWFLILMSLILPLVHLRLWLVKRRRSAMGLCTVCGYDVRANEGRCPECGAELEPQSRAAKPTA